MTTLRSQGLALFGFLAFCSVVFAMMWRFAGGDVDPLNQPYRVQAVVPTAVSLAVHADVRQAGVRIGEVSDIADRGNNTVLMLELDADHAPAYTNARVLVRAKTLSGENYVDLDPGSPEAARVASGGVLPLANAGQAVQLDQLLSSLDRERRRSLQRVLDGLGTGLRGHGEDLNRFLEATTAIIGESAPVDALLAANRQQVASLADDFGYVTRAIGDRRDAVELLVRRSRTLSEAVAARDEALRDTLAALPGFLGQARTTATNLGQFSTGATPVIGDLADASDQLVPAVNRLRPAVAQARRLMGALGGFTERAVPLAEHLEPFATVATRFGDPLEAALRELNPLQAYLARYTQDIGALVSSLRGGNESYDALGHYARVTALFSKSSLFGVLTPEQEAAYQALVDAGVLGPLDHRGHNAYPRPGIASDPEDFQGAYPRVTRDPPYTR